MNTDMKHTAPYMDADAIQAARNAEAAREALETSRTAWESAGKPKADEWKVRADHAAFEDAMRWAGAEARRCLAAYLAR